MLLKKKLVVLAAGVSYAVLSAGMAQAQDAGSAAKPIAREASADEIIVTARKREESAHDVPLSVTAIGGEQFKARGLTELADLSLVTTGLTFRKTSVGFLDFRIRGLGTGGGNDSFEQSVAMFVDGIYFSRSPEFSQPLFDVQRVEVIKGTQASFLAKNTSLGAVSITTRKPGNEWAFDATARYEFKLKSTLFSGGVDVPVTDNLAVRVSGELSTDGGFVKNVLSGVNLGERRVRAGRVVAVWKPASDLDITGMYEEYHNEQIGVPVEVVVDNLGAAKARAVAAGQLANYETNLDYKTMASDSTFGESDDVTKGRFGDLTINKGLGEYTLTSVTAYTEYQKRFLFDNDYYVGTFGDANPYELSVKQYSEELRLASPANAKFNWIAGVLLMDQTWRFHREGFWQQALGIPAGAVGAVTLPGAARQLFDQKTKTLSGFAAINYELVNNLTLSASGRVTHEKREAFFNTITLVPGAYSFLYNPIAPTTLSFTETLVDFSGGAQYKINQNAMLYGSFSRGNKGGGYANTPTNAATAKYGSEHADTFEIGAKLGRGRTYLNLAAFHTKITNFQQSIFAGSAFIFTQSNVTAKGFEAEGSVQLVPGLVASGAVTYSHARNFDDTLLVNAPEWQGNARLSYTKDLNGDLALDVSGGADYTSKVIYGTQAQTVGMGTSAVNTVYLPGRAHTLFDARVGLTGGNGSWSIALIGRNITNTLYPIFTNPMPLIAPGGVGIATPNLPRTISLQFTVRR